MVTLFRRCVVILVVCVAAGAPSAAAAKSYAIPRIAVDGEVTRDGSLHIEESITFAFDGSFSYVYRDIPLIAGEAISEIWVGEQGRPYEYSSDQSPQTYTVTRTETGSRITWYFRARNETRTFVLRFELTGVVKRYADVGELYYQFVGGGWDRTIREVDVTVRLPSDVRPSQIQGWVHGPKLLNGTVAIDPDGTVNMDVSALPPRTFWEGRVLFPSSALSEAPFSSNVERRAAVMAEERRWVEDANRLRERRLAQLKRERARREVLAKRARMFLPASLVLALVAIGFWFAQFRKHGWPHEVYLHAVPGEIPSSHRPAIVSYLMFKTVGAQAIVATLLDLADRGYFAIHETTREKPWFFGTRKETDYRFERTRKLWQDMEPYELALAEFLITEVGDLSGFTMSEFKKTATRNRRRFLKWFQRWVESVKEAGKSLQLFEPYPKEAMIQNAAVGLVAALCGVFFCVYSQSPAGTPAIVAGALALVLTATLNRRTVEGRRLLLAWKGFRNHLGGIAKGLGPVKLDSSEWSRYLGVAIIFGLHKKLLPKLELNDGRGGVMAPMWYHAVADGNVSGVSSLADGLTTMVSSMSTTMSSASGTGGGASVGGGGGSGGGGGGAG